MYVCMYAPLDRYSISVNILTDRSTYQLGIGRYVDWHIGRESADMSTGMCLQTWVCVWLNWQILTLDHVVSANGIQPDPTKMEAIKAMSPPKNVSVWPSIFSQDVWLCCKVYSQLCKYCWASQKAYAKGTEMVLGRSGDNGIRSLEGSTVSQTSLGVFSFRCFNFCGHWCQSHWHT